MIGGNRRFGGRSRCRIPSEDEVVTVEALLSFRNLVSFKQQPPLTTVPSGGPPTKPPEVDNMSPSTPLAFTSMDADDDLSDHHQKTDDPNQHAGTNMINNEDGEIKEVDQNELDSDNKENKKRHHLIEADDDRNGKAKEARRTRKRIIRSKAQKHKYNI